MTPAIVVQLCGLVVSVSTFFVGRLTAAKDKGKENGEVMAELKSIAESVEKIDTRLTRIDTQLGEQRDRLTALETKMAVYHGSHT